MQGFEKSRENGEAAEADVSAQGGRMMASSLR
jgi:hypothetical protein